MGKVVVFTSVTLDGVMQAPARPDEDVRGGFKHGGWAVPYADAISGSMAGQSSGGGLLLGRRTYEDFFAVWPARTDNPFTEILNRTQKYVASRTLRVHPADPSTGCRFGTASVRRRWTRCQTPTRR